MSEIAKRRNLCTSVQSKPAISEHAQEHAPGFSPAVLDMSEIAPSHAPSFSSAHEGRFLSMLKNTLRPLGRSVFDKPREIFNTINFDEGYLPQLLAKLKTIKKRYELFNKINKKIKKDLKDFNILHKDKAGINVIIKFNDNQEKEKIINYCDKNNLEYTICPKGIFGHIRVNCDAISIEVKRL